MNVARNTVVTLNYRVSDSQGNLIDAGERPLVYLHGGYGGIFEKIEHALEGQAVGAQKEIYLQPEDAFGNYDADLISVEPRNLFPEHIEIGMQFERVTAGGNDGLLYTITDIAEDKVVVDGNHPLAGVALVFSCTVAAVRPATEEELKHGCAHP
ncbi:MAG: peptidylprolyl isomerase [Rhodocyclaceae bacterium]|nr:peptidylprolyl isomerase [Rhodocyclaceae bacterium]